MTETAMILDELDEQLGRPELYDIFLHDRPLIDTRAPVEFAKGAFPSAENLPLMNDDERHRIGICYKHSGQEAAIALGHKLVAGERKAERVQAWLDFSQRHPEGYLYCFRGGLRSRTTQQWIRDGGVDYPLIEGGYKAMRQFLIDTLQRRSQQDTLYIVSGRTGSAKTHLLDGLPTAIDLEGLANHRGSSFGRRPGGQPSQIDFENRMAIQWLKIHHHYPDQAIILEDEGRHIGYSTLPLEMFERMQKAPCFELEVPLEQRVETILGDYVLVDRSDFVSHFGEQGHELFAEHLHAALGRIKRRLGGVLHSEIDQLLAEALQQELHEGNTDGHRRWIHRLLTEYYDPMYDYQLERKQRNRVCHGGPDEIKAALSAYRAADADP